MIVSAQCDQVKFTDRGGRLSAQPLRRLKRSVGWCSRNPLDDASVPGYRDSVHRASALLIVGSLFQLPKEQIRSSRYYQ